MSENNKTIHDFEFKLICDYFKGLHRQGPGSPEMTRKALSFIENLPADAKIADLGCGTGGQTMVLGESTTGQITGIDLFPDFIEKFNLSAKEKGLDHRVKGIVGSMDKLPFSENEMDLIWSEGAIYNIGFEDGLKLWHKYIKPGGYVAVSEGTWFTNERPQEIEDFWMGNYPEIDTIPVKVAQMQNAGYIPVATFILPVNCWTEHFFEPMLPVQEEFLRMNENQTARDLVESMKHEKSLYNKYKDYYGYAFYIGKKIVD